ncbi:MAG: hypothetical protein V4526_01805 [Patescibacteria group bacterium]
MTPKPPIIAETPPPLTEEVILKHIGQIAYSTPGFSLWAVKYPDKSAGIGAEELKARFDAFRSIKETSKELKSAYKTELQKEFGIVMEEKDLADVEAFLEQEAIDNPESIPEILGQVKAMRESETELTAAHSELESLSKTSGYEANVASREKKKEDILKVMENRGFLSMATIRINAIFNDKNGMNKSFLELRKKVVGEAGGTSDEDFVQALNKLGEENDELKRQLDLRTAGVEEKIAQAKEKLKEMKTGIFALDSLQDKITKKIEEKLLEHAEKLADINAIKEHKNSLKQANEGLEFTKKYITDKKEENELGIDLSNIDDVDLATRIDEWAEKVARNRFNIAIDKVKIGGKEWENMHKAFVEFMSLEKIGTKEGDEAREWLVQDMERAIRVLRGDDFNGNVVSMGPDFDAKANILEIMLSKLLSA